MGLIDVVKSAFGVGKPKNMMTLRPTELDSWTRGSADIAKMPIIPFVGYRFVSEIYMYSDLLKTVIRSLVQETFRKGITIVPRFVVKCNICGSDYDAKVEKCEVCGSDSLRPPNYFEREYLEKWLNDVNFNDQSLIEVLQDVDTDLNIYDNAYLAVVKRYFYNDKGEVVGSEVVEVLRANPEYVMLVIDREGRPARTDDGKVAMFCLEHRDRYVTLLPEQVEDARCAVCGRKLYPVYYTVRKWSQGGTVCYTNGEILHIKKFTHGLGYGISPIFSVWMKVLTLIKMDFFILTAYHLERPPKGVLVLRGQMESIQKAWHRLQEEARNNPHMIYPFVVEGADKAPRIAEWIDLSFSAKDIEFIQYREEIRRTVGALFGVMPVFQGDTGAGVGLANEGLQIVVTNRAVEREQTLFNEKVLPWLIRQMGVSDWEYQLIPNEGRDVVARIQRETMRIANAERMAALGYKPVAVKTDDGIDFYYEVGGKEIQESERSGYIASKVYQEIPEREIPRYEGEPEHGRPRTDEQRFEGEELGRRPKEGDTFVVGEGGKLIPEGEVGKGFFLEKQKTVPKEYRRYISMAQVPKLPFGTKVYRGPRGGLFIDIREITDRSVLEEIEPEELEPSETSERGEGEVQVEDDVAKVVARLYEGEEDEGAKLSIMEEGYYFANYSLAVGGIIDVLTYRSMGSIEGDEENINEIRSNIEKAYDVLIWKGLSLDVAKSLATVGPVIYGYTKKDFKPYAAALDFLDNRVYGNDRPRRRTDVDNMAPLQYAQMFVDEKDFKVWVEFCKEFMKQVVTGGKDKFVAYRGITDFELGQLVLARVLGKKTARLFGGVQSFSLSSEVAEEFSEVVIRSVLDVKDVRGGFWMSDYPNEAEVIVSVPPDGVKVDISKIDFRYKYGFADYIPHIDSFNEFLKKGDVEVLRKEVEEGVAEIAQGVEGVYRILANLIYIQNTLVVNLLGLANNPVSYRYYISYLQNVRKIVKKLVDERDSLFRMFGGDAGDEYFKLLAGYVDEIEQFVLDEDYLSSTSRLRSGYEYIKETYEGGYEKFARDNILPVVNDLRKLIMVYYGGMDDIGGEGDE
jgi:hypothetical protein